MTKITSVFIFFLTFSFSLKGQDAQFSQYYSSFTYLNPALSGVIDNAKAGVQYRSQWENANAPYTSTLAYGAFLFEKAKSSLSFTYHGNEQGNQSFTQNFLMLGYAYNVKLSDNINFIPAIQAGYNTEKIDYSNTVFGDQLTEEGATNVTGEQLTNNAISYTDFNIGMLLVGKKAFIGSSLSHLAEPNNSITETESNKLYRKLVVHSGLRLVTNDTEDKSWLLTGVYKSQGKFDQLDLGTYLDLKHIALGVWYRGLPIKKYNNFSNNESIIGMAGVKIKGITAAYSYDYVISDLASNAHEISLYYEFKINQKEVAPKKGLPIPMF